MRYRLTFIAGLAVGYVLGARAGRERYEQLREGGRRIAGNPAVRNARETAAQNGRQMATRAYDTVNERVGHRLPEAMTDRVHSLVNGHGPRGDDWGTGGA
ncbi:YtxH domain-containing protein [Streptomyces sp. JJ36]|uniref:YtxH domain-containing protein n=1 Tax=Streptomyces sp. JJ36 TaxID=2736645 RepID=UPI001F20FD45|nr:YtxH domain-containing protein [Streptomyces sp. JJ36]MCF6526143.1 YtxH domain-containing protein [Streptomyces sp. JJ36]